MSAPRVSSRVLQVKPSGIRRFFDLMENMKDCISLGIGEPDFQTPWHIRDAAIYTLEKGLTKYTPNAGYKALRQAISRYAERSFGLSYNYDNEILVTVGGSEAIDIAMRALTNPGDEVIIPEPSFVCYVPITIMAGAAPVIIETKEENRFRLTAAELRAAITPKTRVLILPYPCNPTGGIMEAEDIEAITAVLREHPDIAVISDEIYAELTYGLKHTSIASYLRDRTVFIGGLSKSHAMTGWRMGYACGHSDVISQMMKIHQFAIMCAPTTSQYAAIEALDKGDGDVERMRDDYDYRRRFFVESLRSLGLTCFEPQGAFYAFPNVAASGLSSGDFCEKLLVEQKVAMIPGNAFGESGEGFARCCYATSAAELKTALERIDKFLNK
ncbi:MAG: aminotransferase class I/II-fold pyridoxal phosphate-dependent enzyme [Oscillospiraceae bacterium]|nr:aminotransferase class I/II-fold pyridoxal phosphate-dependent enzyme [Oscillospiraceae bacterium]